MTTAPGPVPVEPTHAWLITLQRPVERGVLATFTTEGTYTAKPGATRQSAYREIRALLDRQHPELAGANVLFFSLEPNRL
ncbi:hypothetical protein ACIQOV_16985 [Kitasatospora sp. NPDC091257]|uniref:hypothetical protein n=1 Tax=Kitasatospora sp. NPDC091257 TaxID=3364084 RepID=UPI003810F6D9